MFRLLKIIWAASKLDPFALNPVCSDEKLSRGLRAIDARTQRHFAIEFALQIARMPVRTLRSGVVSLIRRKQLAALCRSSFRPLLIVSTSVNQERALGPIVEKLPEEKYRSLQRPEVILLNDLANVFTPFFVIPLALAFLSANRFVKRTFCYHLTKYLSVYCWYVVGRIVLQDKTRVLVLSNDHCHIFCALRKAASDEGIRTAYIQHASVTRNFPPLEFDYAILDGMDSAMKYTKPGSRSTVFLAGMARRNKKPTERNRTEQQVGVCFNMLDDEVFIRNLTSTIRQELPDLNFLIRLHPSTPLAVAQSLNSFFAEQGFRTSDAKSESPTEFFEQISLMVAGNSSVVLEASLHGIDTICIFSPDAEDEYEFCKHGLATRASDLGELVEKISASIRCGRTPQKELLQNYDAGYGRPNYSASEQIASTLQHLSCKRPELGNWTEIETPGTLSIFQPKSFHL